MDYAATLHWLYARLPMYQRVGGAALNPNLDRITKLVAYLGNPHHKFKSIHIAGTNGKGSSSHMLASVLQEAGYQVGLYTSPHLKDFRERIRLNGVPIPKSEVVSFVTNHRDFFEQEQCSFFEMTVALAFDYFASQKVDVAVIEVGLGGRLDATNIIMPEGCLITNIGLDHQQFLGNTRAKIAGEKAGVIKPKVPVVVVEHDDEILPVFKEVAAKESAPLFIADSHNYCTDLLGDYQKRNSNGVVSLLHQLPQFGIDEAHIQSGLQCVVKNTGLRGRWEVLGENPKIIADVAHNPAGLQAVFSQLNTLHFEKLHIVFGVVNDKALDAILALLPKSASYYLCAANVPRAMDVEVLASHFQADGFLFSTHNSTKAAFVAAKTAASKKDIIYVGGSLFVVAEILP
jgi:dihydrofolate synthase/folylpolyglutamate synthase